MTMHTRPWRDATEAQERRTLRLSIDAELASAAAAMNIDPALALEEAIRNRLAQAANDQPPEAAPAAAW